MFESVRKIRRECISDRLRPQQECPPMRTRPLRFRKGSSRETIAKGGSVSIADRSGGMCTLKIAGELEKSLASFSKNGNCFHWYTLSARVSQFTITSGGNYRGGCRCRCCGHGLANDQFGSLAKRRWTPSGDLEGAFIE